MAFKTVINPVAYSRIGCISVPSQIRSHIKYLLPSDDITVLD